MFLVTKASKAKVDINNKPKVKIIRPPMRLDKVHISSLPDGSFVLVYLNEYHVATAAYTFHGDNARMWLDRIKSAQEDFHKIQVSHLDQNEAPLHPAAANGYVESSDDFVHISPPSPQPELVRNASASSAETYMGTEGFPRTEAVARDTLQTDSESERMRKRSTLSLPDYETAGSSPPGSPGNNRKIGATTANPTSASVIRFEEPDQSPGMSSTSEESLSQAEGGRKSSSENTNNNGTELFENKFAHVEFKKMNPRRDRRYYTADAIQEMNHGKDSSIQKRLSWHSGAKDTDYEYRHGGGFRHKASSSDSLRSIHSSSGVSSVGSLQGPEHDISEETSEWSEGSSTTVNSGFMPKSHSDFQLGGETLASPTVDVEVEDTPFQINIVDADTVVVETEERSPSSLSNHVRTVSKSMPDISQLTTSGDREGGTVEQIREEQRRKLSQLQHMKLKLLNSTLEAT